MLCFAGQDKLIARYCASLCCALKNALALHVRNPSQHCKDQFSNTRSDPPQAMHLNGYPSIQQAANSGLHIQSIVAQAINCLSMNAVSLAVAAQCSALVTPPFSWAQCSSHMLLSQALGWQRIMSREGGMPGSTLPTLMAYAMYGSISGTY
ncbi:hypothetical protein [Comamonas endophytica]|uniref:Uncharacterized protein n=1 Tax=Comamonas endophytica TaxID=2949090 RepID=A0ABY6G8F1_9BURK|nr:MULTISPECIES: hypothetical protein [unclassified Acidovorax]MCD2514166.1 hypothetical protein [Acidovorax sp. D4N7]UYG51305.1 hypothetical protein M9799_14770 [Acidovorax sp. 5MLIR]